MQQIEIKDKTFYFFECENCYKRRSSVFKEIAEAGICRKCRREQVIDPNQQTLL